MAASMKIFLDRQKTQFVEVPREATLGQLKSAISLKLYGVDNVALKIDHSDLKNLRGETDGTKTLVELGLVDGMVVRESPDDPTNAAKLRAQVLLAEGRAEAQRLRAEGNEADISRAVTEAQASIAAAGQVTAGLQDDLNQLGKALDDFVQVVSPPFVVEADNYSLRFDVEVISARNLAAMDSNGKSDPYVQIWFCENPDGSCSFNGPQDQKSLAAAKFSDEVRKNTQISITEIQKKTLNPVWNHRFFAGFLPESRSKKKAEAGLQFRVYDHDTFSKDDLIGLAYPPQDLEFYADGERHELELEVQEKSNKDRGFLKIAITIKPDGRRVSPGRIGKTEGFRALSTPQQAIRAILKVWQTTHGANQSTAGPNADAFKAVQKIADDLARDELLLSVTAFWPRLCIAADPLLDKADALQGFEKALASLVAEKTKA